MVKVKRVKDRTYAIQLEMFESTLIIFFFRMLAARQHEYVKSNRHIYLHTKTQRERWAIAIGKIYIVDLLKIIQILLVVCMRFLQVCVDVNGVTEEYKHTIIEERPLETDVGTPPVQQAIPVEKGQFSFRLEDLAFARSGDKGNHCNIGKWLLIVNS